MPNGDYGYEHARDAQWARDANAYLRALLASACVKMISEDIELPPIVKKWWSKMDYADQSQLVGKAIAIQEEMKDD